MEENILKNLCPTDKVYKELLEYTKNGFSFEKKIPDVIPDESFIEIWSRIVERCKRENVQDVINDEIPHGETDVSLKRPDLVNIEIYNSVAGNIPVIYARDPEDFYELVTQIINHGKKMPNIEKTGASFAFGKSNKFIVLSNKPYSNIPAKEINLDEDTWKGYSIIIRREHECTHYFTKRFLGSSKQNLHDELVADFAGIFCATGKFYADWFLKGLGLDKYPKEQPIGRFPVYTTELSNEAKEVLKGIIVKVAYNVESWSKTNEAQNMSRNEKILFLCKNSLVDLYSMN